MRLRGRPCILRHSSETPSSLLPPLPEHRGSQSALGRASAGDLSEAKGAELLQLTGKSSWHKDFRGTERASCSLKPSASSLKASVWRLLGSTFLQFRKEKTLGSFIQQSRGTWEQNQSLMELSSQGQNPRLSGGAIGESLEAGGAGTHWRSSLSFRTKLSFWYFTTLAWPPCVSKEVNSTKPTSGRSLGWENLPSHGV